jgi:O-antigen ligase
MLERTKISGDLTIFGILVLSLWGTVTALVPVSVTFAVLAPAVPYLLWKNKFLPPSVIALLALLGYFLLSTLCYAPDSLADPGFYRRDGNVFVTFLPVIIGGAARIRTNVEQLIARFAAWVTWVDLAFIGIFLATGGTLFLEEAGVYHLLFESHNAAGGFLAMTLCFMLGLYFGGRKSLPLLAMLFVNTIGLILTLSRGSILGIALAVPLVLGLKERFARLIVATIAIGTIGILTYTYPLWISSGMPTGIYSPEDGTMSAEEVGYADPNTIDRLLFLWPRALYIFFKSPIVGTGFGSYNDLPYSFPVGIPNVFAFNHPAAFIFSDKHAHNTYLHVLGETGLVGLGLLIFFLWKLWKDIDSLQSPSVRLGLKLGYWMAILSSLTEHRMFTPSEMLPFTIILGLALGCRHYGLGDEGATTDGRALAAPTEPAIALPLAASAGDG